MDSSRMIEETTEALVSSVNGGDSWSTLYKSSRAQMLHHVTRDTSSHTHLRFATRQLRGISSGACSTRCGGITQQDLSTEPGEKAVTAVDDQNVHRVWRSGRQRREFNGRLLRYDTRQDKSAISQCGRMSREIGRRSRR